MPKRQVSRSNLSSMIYPGAEEDWIEASLRHEVLQLAIIFMCGINQLSPGAYFLRRDLFGSILSVSN